MINGIIDSNQKIVTDGLVFHLDAAQLKSYPRTSPNKFPTPIDIVSFSGTGANAATISRDTIKSPVGNSPLKMVVTGNDPHVSMFGSPSFLIATAANGQRWVVSVYVKASVATTGEIYIFGSAADGDIFNATTGQISAHTVNIGTDWTRVSHAFTFTKNVSYIQIRLDGPNSGGSGQTIWWDGVQVEQVSTGVSAPTVFTSTNIWTDLSGNTNTGTLTNGPTFNSSNGGSIVFDGLNDYGTIANGSSLITTNLTIEVVVSLPNSQILQPDTVSYAGQIIGLHGTTNYFRECSMGISNTGNLPNATTFGASVQFLNQTGNTFNSIGFGTFNFSSTPLFLTYTQVGTTASTYVNGNLVNTGTITKYSRPASMTLDIGYINNTFRYIYLRGGICNIKIYNRALSAAEVLQNYDATKSRFGL